MFEGGVAILHLFHAQSRVHHEAGAVRNLRFLTLEMCLPLSPPSGRKLERVVHLERMFRFLLQRYQAENPGVQWTFLRRL